MTTKSSLLNPHRIDTNRKWIPSFRPPRAPFPSTNCFRTYTTVHGLPRLLRAPLLWPIAFSVSHCTAHSPIRSAPAMSTASEGFAAPHARFSPPVREFVDQLIADASSPSSVTSSQLPSLLPHLERGLAQLEEFMRHAHAGVDSFDALVARESASWREHLDVAEKDGDVRVQTRSLPLETLRVPLVSCKDVKVGKPGRPDDAVYQKSEYARRFLPRGNFLAEYAGESLPQDGAPYYFPLLRGYRKFTGQEDDGELQPVAQDGGDKELLLSKFFTKPVALSRWIISTTKENGEAGHLSVLKRRDGGFVFALGSKNTHLLATSLDDIDAFYPGDAFQAARPMSKAVLKTVLSLPADKRALLCEFLWQTRATACFEVLCPSHQHVQLLDYIDEDTPVFFGLSLPLLEPLAGAEVCVNPMLPLAIMRALGVRTVDSVVFDYDPSASMEEQAEITKAHAQYQHEGAVNLFLDVDANVIGMEKHKTVWYVCLRAIREKAKTFCGNLDSKKKKKSRSRRGRGTQQGGGADERPLTPQQVLSASKQQLRRRFAAIQPYLQISDEVTRAYRSLGEQFFAFLLAVKLAGGSGDVQSVKREVADLFPVVWKQFLDHTQLSDDIAVP